MRGRPRGAPGPGGSSAWGVPGGLAATGSATGGRVALARTSSCLGLPGNRSPCSDGRGGSGPAGGPGGTHGHLVLAGRTHGHPVPCLSLVFSGRGGEATPGDSLSPLGLLRAAGLPPGLRGGRGRGMLTQQARGRGGGAGDPRAPRLGTGSEPASAPRAQVPSPETTTEERRLVVTSAKPQAAFLALFPGAREPRDLPG